MLIPKWNNKFLANFGGGSTFHPNPNLGLGPKGVNIISPQANFSLDAGGEFVPWPSREAIAQGDFKWHTNSLFFEQLIKSFPEVDTRKIIKNVYRHQVCTTDLSFLRDNKLKLDLVWLSHSHADHVAGVPLLLPYLSDESKIYGSPHTLDIMKKVFRDTLRHSPYVYRPINGLIGVASTLQKKEVLNVGATELAPGLTFYGGIAGHIPGAMYGIFEFKDGPIILDTGDIASFWQPLVPGTTLIDDIKNKIVPTPNVIIGTDFTNSSRKEFSWEPTAAEFCEKVKRHLEEGRTIIIGAFENSRTQNIAESLRAFGIKPIWVDGGGRDIYEIYAKHYKWSPLYPAVPLEDIEYVTSKEQRIKMLEDKTPKVIITTAGMFDGGPIEEYLERGLENEKFVFFITSYTAPGTKGEKLRRSKDKRSAFIKLPNQKRVAIKAKIETAGFTAHDNILLFERLVKTIYQTNGGQRIKIFMTHGTEEGKKVAAELVQSYADCLIVSHGQTYDLQNFEEWRQQQAA